MSRKCFTAEHQIQCVAHQIGWSASSLVRPYFQHALELLGNGCLALFRQLADVQAGFQNFVVVKASHFAIGGVGKTPDLVGFFTHRVVSVCGLGCFALRFGFGKIGKQTNLVDLANVAFAKIKQLRAKFIIRAKYQPCAKLRNRRLSATANLCNLHLGNACALQF